MENRIQIEGVKGSMWHSVQVLVNFMYDERAFLCTLGFTQSKHFLARKTNCMNTEDLNRTGAQLCPQVAVVVHTSGRPPS